jgi:hypothetical protein
LILTNNVDGEIYIPNEIRDKPFQREKAKTSNNSPESNRPSLLN